METVTRLPLLPDGLLYAHLEDGGWAEKTRVLTREEGSSQWPKMVQVWMRIHFPIIPDACGNRQSLTGPEMWCWLEN